LKPFIQFGIFRTVGSKKGKDPHIDDSESVEPILEPDFDEI